MDLNTSLKNLGFRIFPDRYEHKDEEMIYFLSARFLENKIPHSKEKQKIVLFPESLDKIEMKSEDISIALNSFYEKTKELGGIDCSKFFSLSRDKINKLRNDINIINSDRNVKAGEKNQEISEILVQALYVVKQFYSIRNDDKDELWIYEEGIYIPNGKSHIEQFCRVVLETNYNQNIFNLCCDKIRADNYITAEEFFRKEQESPELLPVLNGVLNVKTRKLLPFSPEYIFFSKVNAEYNPEAKCPNIDNFLSEVLKKSEDKTIFYEMVGSCIYKEYYLQTAFMCVGDGENGKGISLDLIKAFLGDGNYSALPLSSITSEGFRVSELFGKLSNIAGDLSNTDLKDSGMFKAVTSGTDPISADRKWKNALTFVNYATMIFACNELPRVYDCSRGFWRRWRILEFPYTFLKPNEYLLRKSEANVKLAKQDTELKSSLVCPSELSGLLNEALSGLNRLFSNRQYSTTESTEQIKEFWIRKSDSFQAFCMDCIEENFETYIDKKTLRKRFNQYCKTHGVKGCSDLNIKIVLQNMFGVIESRKTIGTEFERVWEGINFKQEQKVLPPENPTKKQIDELLQNGEKFIPEQFDNEAEAKEIISKYLEQGKIIECSKGIYGRVE